MYLAMSKYNTLAVPEKLTPALVEAKNYSGNGSRGF